MKAAALLAAALGSGACVTSTTMLQTARPADGGRVGLGMSVPISTRFVSELAGLAGTASDRLSEAEDAGRPVTEEEQQEAMEALMATVLFQSPPVTELSGRVGLADDLDFGLRFAGPAIRGDAKYDFLGASDDHLHLAGILGYAYHTDIGASIASSVYGLAERFDLAEYSRHDLDAALLLSNDSGSWFTGYLGARYLAAFASFEGRLADALEAESGRIRTDTSAVIHHVGGTAGMQASVYWFRFLLELTVLKVFFEPTILGRRFDLGGYLISPGVGIAAEF